MYALRLTIAHISEHARNGLLTVLFDCLLLKQLIDESIAPSCVGQGAKVGQRKLTGGRAFCKITTAVINIGFPFPKGLKFTAPSRLGPAETPQRPP